MSMHTVATSKKRYRLGKALPTPDGLWPLVITMFFLIIGMVSILFGFEPYAHYHIGYISQASDYNAVTSIFLFHFSCIVGGLLGQLTDHRRMVIIGILFSAVCLALMAIQNLALIALAGYSIGFGLALPNLYTTLSFLYTRDDSRRNAGFIIMYLGYTLAFLIGGALAYAVLPLLSYEAWFAIMSGVTLLGALAFVSAGKSLNSHESIIRRPSSLSFLNKEISPLLTIVICICLSVLMRALLVNVVLLHSVIIITAIAILLGCLTVALIRFKKMPMDQRQRFYGLIVLTAAGFLMWFAQRFTSVMLNQVYPLFETLGPISVFGINLDPFFYMVISILTVALLVGIFYWQIWRQNRSMHHGTKIFKSYAIAAIFLLIAISLILFGSYFTIEGHLNLFQEYLFSLIFFFNSVASILFVPLYYAIIGKFAPRHYEPWLMGCFLLWTALIGIFAFNVAQPIAHAIFEKFAHPPVIAMLHLRYFYWILFGVFFCLIPLIWYSIKHLRRSY